MPKASKPEVEEISPRKVRKGQVILIKGTNQAEAVRSIQIVLDMANGQTLTYDVSEVVESVVDPDEAGYADIIDTLPASEEDQRPVEVIRIRKLDELRHGSEDAVEVAAVIEATKAEVLAAEGKTAVNKGQPKKRVEKEVEPL